MEALKNRMDWPWKHGNPMVQNLLKAGFEVVVFNRTKDKERTNSVSATWSQSTRDNYKPATW
jgi:3-hydroxyisobutyrate dehydrogenase-like beta-hydroxyacid dehydrogenase